MCRLHRSELVLAAAVLFSSCGGIGPSGLVDEDDAFDLSCSIPIEEIYRGARLGVIPALTNPRLDQWGGPETEYLELEDRVVGIVLAGEPIAIPLNIFWWHEIVNLDGDGAAVAVTHCPLTGSTLAFDRTPVGGARFDVSGLLYNNNLLMFDRGSGSASLWPQLLRGARCGSRDGTVLPMVPTLEVTWEAWRRLYPNTKVVTSDTGYARDYTDYPYGDPSDPTNDYDHIDNPYTLFPVSPSMDRRRPPKERVFGIPDGDGGVALPFGELETVGFAAAVHGETTAGDFVVFWKQLRGGAAAYRPSVGGRDLTFRARGSVIEDDQTSSQWSLSGEAVAGPLEGERLEPVADAFVAFWFAWPAFYPDIELWTAP